VSAHAAPTVRPATHDDLPAIRTILAAHGNDGPVLVADIVGPYLRHLIGRGGALVAQVEDFEGIAGFGAGIDTGRSVHLADLFVDPERLGKGIGHALLDAVFEGAIQRTTFASDDPRAIPLYVRAGMQPLWTSFYVQGRTRGLPAVPDDHRTEAATAERLAALELEWTGHDRTIDHAYWATVAGADGFVVWSGREVAAIGYARDRQAAPIRVLDRLLIHPDADPVTATIAARARAGRSSPVLGCLLGPNPALRPLLESGFRIVDRDLFLATDPDLVDPVRLIPNPGML
jgi:GNAT superfamily N-acetyltransferase